MKVNISIPRSLVEQIEALLRSDGTWGTSVADFVRQAAAEKVRELRADDPKLTDGEVRAAREARAR